MKKMISLVMLYIVVVSFLGTDKISNKEVVYNNIREEFNIVEQGIKIQYQEDTSIDKIKSFLGINEIDVYGENFEYKHNNENFSIHLKSIDSFIELELIVKSNQVKIEELEKISTDKFKAKNNLEIFTYIKGEINENHNLDEYLSDNTQMLKIDNGYTGIINANDDNSLNYAIKNYGKDNNYIIVGSPVIFISY